MKNSKQLETCVFYFFNEYEVKVKKQKIHKIIHNDFFIQNELTNQKKILKIHDINKYFFLCENTSELKITQIDEHDTTINKSYTTYDDTILLVYEKRQLTVFKNYLKALNPPKKYILTI